MSRMANFKGPLCSKSLVAIKWMNWWYQSVYLWLKKCVTLVVGFYICYPQSRHMHKNWKHPSDVGGVADGTQEHRHKVLRNWSLHRVYCLLEISLNIPCWWHHSLHSAFLSMMASYLDLLDHQRRKGIPREGKVITAKAAQSSWRRLWFYTCKMVIIK